MGIQVVRIEVEDEVCSEPPLLLHRRGIRGFVVDTRIVRMSRDPAREERSKLLLPPKAKVSLDDPRGPEHEAELATAEPVRRRRLGGLVVAVELGLQEMRRRLFRKIGNRHGEKPSESRP